MKNLYIILIFIFIIFTGCTKKNSTIEDIINKIDINQNASTTDNSNSITISRALVAKMIALTYNTKPEIIMTDRDINFSDTDKTKWYDKYINIVKIQGYMIGGEGYFKPDDPLKLYEAKAILDKLDPNNTQKLKITEENKEKPISYALWLKLYYNALKNTKDPTNIEEKSIIILATKENNSSMPEWDMIADNGPLSYEGLDLSSYIDKQIKILVKDNEIIGMLELENETPIIKNAFVVQNDAENITIFSGGVERTYKYNSSENYKNKICDIIINKENALSVIVYDDQITDAIKLVDKDKIELENIGIKNFTEDAKIYSIAEGPVKWRDIDNLTVGTNIAYYVLNDGKIGAAIITKIPSPFNIRVLLSTTSFESPFHKSVTISSDEDFTIKAKDLTKEYKAQEKLIISETQNKDLFGSDRLIIKTKSDYGKINIESIDRNGEFPKYRGTIEVSKNQNGFLIVNELGLDEYLYGVIPSEMPTKFGLEAAKVQAVSARSYAYVQFFENKYHEFGANIDDTVNCQVYNNIPENDTSIKAVNETKNLFITYDNQVVSTNFFSTSCGVTANSGEVWADTEANLFPSHTKPYLTSQAQYSANNSFDLSNEDGLALFFKSTDIDSFDKASPWFRWNVTMTTKQLSDSINNSLALRFSANSSLIKTLQDDNYYRSKPIKTIGTLKDIEIIKRGEAGNVMQLKIIGTEATIMVYTEYNIRALLSPKSTDSEIIINRFDNTQLANYSILPSAFFTLDKKVENNVVTSITFYGGGNGHGVGMSQNGVKGMIDQNYNFDQIIKHYFSGVEIKEIS